MSKEYPNVVDTIKYYYMNLLFALACSDCIGVQGLEALRREFTIFHPLRPEPPEIDWEELKKTDFVEAALHLLSMPEFCSLMGVMFPLQREPQLCAPVDDECSSPVNQDGRLCSRR